MTAIVFSGMSSSSSSSNSSLKVGFLQAKYHPVNQAENWQHKRTHSTILLTYSTAVVLLV